MKHKILFIIFSIGYICKGLAQVAYPLNSVDKITLYSSFKSSTPYLSLDAADMDKYIIEFQIKEFRKQRAFVKLWQYDTDSDFAMTFDSLWINSSEIGVYGRIREGANYVLYKCPNRETKKYKFPAEETEGMFKVLDYQDGWFKVIVVYKKRKHKLWLPPEGQCHDYFNSCT